ncbi:MAG: stress response translation initiation inhibitor YciH [Oligoflexia bacterium]|nr:stress response translation initiation inhibitor YciH [Oligoflexia bacterium]MBF0364663.1 stress response translation initiation inhibitor YciH [Oligoflexia bacterium]
MVKEKAARLVYSSDPLVNQKCPKCKELLCECHCMPEEDATRYKGPVGLRIEKQGRGGKTVTVIAKLPRNELYLKNLTASLKKKCGSGGTYAITEKEGLIEIQGDKRELIRATLEKDGIKVK